MTEPVDQQPGTPRWVPGALPTARREPARPETAHVRDDVRGDVRADAPPDVAVNGPASAMDAAAMDPVVGESGSQPDSEGDPSDRPSFVPADEVPATAPEQPTDDGQTTVLLRPDKPYIVMLTLLTLGALALVLWLVFWVARGNVVWQMLVLFAPFVLFVGVLWWQVFRPGRLVLDREGMTLRRPFTKPYASAWVDLDDLRVRPFGSRTDLETGPISLHWDGRQGPGKLVVVAAQTPDVLAALRRHTPARLADDLR